MDQHQKDRQQERLVCRRRVARILNTRRSEDHSRCAVIDRRCPGDLPKPVAPASDPGRKRTPAWRRKHS